MRLQRLAAAHPLPAALVAEGLLIPLALGLAVLLGETPWADFHWPLGTLMLSIIATAPLVGLLGLFTLLGPTWFRELEALVQPAVAAVFNGHGRVAVAVAALIAGFGEELLFRGVVQSSLAGWAGPWVALVLASVVFGLLHALSRAYFVLATIMGLYLGAIYQVTGNLMVASLVHAFYDWVALEMVLSRVDRDPEPG